ncbi:hypothetical protein HG530_014418 [Fusarium avenaceum]|nr:hypothetical protein HG530_014418 [Fusarium avenaceum]
MDHWSGFFFVYLGRTLSFHQSTNQGTQHVGDLAVSTKVLGAVAVHRPASQSHPDHNGRLLPLGLVDEAETHGEPGHEEKVPTTLQRPIAGRTTRCIAVDHAVQRSTDGDAVSEEESVDKSVDHANTTSDDVMALKLERTAEDHVAWENQGDTALRQSTETE